MPPGLWDAGNAGALALAIFQGISEWNLGLSLYFLEHLAILPFGTWISLDGCVVGAQEFWAMGLAFRGNSQQNLNNSRCFPTSCAATVTLP